MCLQLSSRQVLEAYIARIRVIQPIINAVTDYDWDTALKEADEVDRVLREAADIPGELSEYLNSVDRTLSPSSLFGNFDLNSSLYAFYIIARNFAFTLQMS